MKIPNTVDPMTFVSGFKPTLNMLQISTGSVKSERLSEKVMMISSRIV